MISTSVIHIHTALLPFYFGGTAIILHSTGRIKQKNKLKDISYRLFMLTGLITTFTCAFGGASIRKVEALPGVDPLIVKLHAWSAMLAFLLSLVLAFLSLKIVHRQGDQYKTDKLLLLISLFFITFFICTTVIAFKIR